MKPFLKWPGGKYRQVERIREQLGDGDRLIEPFVGSGAVFMNTHYKRYLLADSNPDLINLYKQLQMEGAPFIKYCQRFFTAKNNHREQYYLHREQFNETRDMRLKSALFLYLNRHGYNGLCRYNSKGKFNVPFGRYERPYFPETEMGFFYDKSARAEFLHAHFSVTMRRAKTGDVVYCDPPYMPLTDTAHFTSYASGGFNWEDQNALAILAGQLSAQGIRVVVSNHNTKSITRLYQNNGAAMERFKVRRTISCKANQRAEVSELLAVFQN